MVGEGGAYLRRPAMVRGAEGAGATVLSCGGEAPMEYGNRRWTLQQRGHGEKVTHSGNRVHSAWAGSSP
jgi:hypothetical protein